MSRNETQEYKARLKEITEVLRKHNITRGVPPEKLRLILEDLGPTFIKLGQIMSMHSDVLPKRYCDELMRLRSEVSPMPFSQVEETLQEAYGCPWNKIFKEIDEKPLGSASIAQVHRAVLKTGEKVVVKVQRQGIYNTMARDMKQLIENEYLVKIESQQATLRALQSQINPHFVYNTLESISMMALVNFST